MLYVSIFMKYLEYANLEKESKFAVAEGGREELGSDAPWA